MSEANKALYRRFIDDVINKQNVAVIDELIAPNITAHNPAPGQEPGVEGMKNLMSMSFAAFPDLNSNLDFMVAEGDIVARRMTTTGTHKGDLMGIPATGKKITMTEIHIFRIANGKAVEHWANVDALGMMQQLGVIPSE